MGAPCHKDYFLSQLSYLYSMLSLEERKKLLKKIAVYFGLIQIFALGVINASYNTERWPSSRGFQLLFDFIFVGFTNPYALLAGIVVYFLFNRWSEKAEEMDEGKLDKMILVLLALLVVLTVVLMQGIIVY